MWREQTQGSFMFVLNAVMNFEHLGTGRAAPRPTPTVKSAADDLQ
jgi:hypothetical protein